MSSALEVLTGRSVNTVTKSTTKTASPMNSPRWRCQTGVFPIEGVGSLTS
jgi:hypothetical protein